MTPLTFDRVTKIYTAQDGENRYALRDVSFDLISEKNIAVMGRSGSGKSTLLHLAAGIDIPSQGKILLQGRDIGALPDKDRTLLRRRDVGLIFQFFHLLPELSVRDNIALPAMISGERDATMEARLRELLDRVGLLKRLEDPVRKLSGGEMQRIAICRALLPRPRLLLADEPTGNLDDDSSRQVMDLLLKLTREQKATLMFVTHSRELASLADEIWTLRSGQLERP
jgi:ABC-type lipoprotein export system ATPase subunit